jgi:hypothetical protein
MDSLISKLNMSVLVDSERILLTSALNSGAVRLRTQHERDSRSPPPEEDSSEGALVKRLKADLRFAEEELQREKKLSECRRLLRKLDWCLLSYDDWCFASDALTAGCRRSFKREPRVDIEMQPRQLSNDNMTKILVTLRNKAHDVSGHRITSEEERVMVKTGEDPHELHAHPMSSIDMPPPPFVGKANSFTQCTNTANLLRLWLQDVSTPEIEGQGYDVDDIINHCWSKSRLLQVNMTGHTFSVLFIDGADTCMMLQSYVATYTLYDWLSTTWDGVAIEYDRDGIEAMLKSIRDASAPNVSYFGDVGMKPGAAESWVAYTTMPQ